MSFLRDPKRLLAVLITGVAGMVVLIDFGSNVPLLTALAFLLVDWAAILTALALLVGLLSLTGSHLRRVSRRESDWGYSLVLLLSMLAVILVGVVGIPGVTVLPQNLAEEPIRRFFRLVYEPLAGSLLALLAFFSLSAVLRALRRRSPEALVIVIVATLVLISQVPPIALLPLVGDGVRWLNDVLVMAGARGLLIGAAIGAMVAGVRVLLGFDLPYLDR
jgi:hypothetical protein